MAEFRPLIEADLPVIDSIEQQAQRHPWSYSILQGSFGPLSLNLGLIDEGKLRGYIFGQYIAGEAEILNITIDQSMQRRGLGRELLSAYIEQVQQLGGERLLLEVRHSNKAARALYQSYGFQLDGHRGHYYPLDNGGFEDALLMSLQL